MIGEFSFTSADSKNILGKLMKTYYNTFRIQYC